MRASKVAANSPWAIRQEDLQLILEVAAMTREERAGNLEAALGRIRAVQSKRSKRMDGTEDVGLRGNVAVLPIHGPIMRRADFFTEWSGGTTLDTLSTDLQAALDNPAVQSILLDVDSPGGEVAGIAEFAAAIRAANKTKPVTAYVDDLGASAAFWIASAAGEVIVSPTAQIGSVGVVATYTDTSKRDAARGIEQIQFVSSQSPHKRPDLDTDAGRAKVQELVDSLAAVFIGAVAGYRDVTEAAVIADFGQGWLLVGQDAVDAGMADRVGSFESVVAELAGDSETRPMFGRSAVGALKGEGGVMAGKPGFWDRAKTFFAQEGISDEEADAKPPAANPAAVLTSPELTALQEQNATLQEQVNRLLAGQQQSQQASLAAQAREFVQSGAVLSRTYPNERAGLLQALTDAATDDAANPRAAGAKSRFETLKDAINARPQHNLTTEMLQGRLPAGAMLLENSGGSGTSLTDEGAELGKKAATAANGKGGK